MACRLQVTNGLPNNERNEVFPTFAMRDRQFARHPHSISGRCWLCAIYCAVSLQTYGDLVNSPERIPTNILADRLKRLEGAGIIVRNEYQQRPTRYAYTLTPKGNALRDVLRAMVAWRKNTIPGTLVMNQGPKKD